MIKVVTLSGRACPFYTIHANAIIEIQIIFERAWSGMFWLRILYACTTLIVSCSLNHLWSETLLQHESAHSLRTRMSHVLVDFGNCLLFILWKSLEGFMFVELDTYGTIRLMMIYGTLIMIILNWWGIGCCDISR